MPLAELQLLVLQIMARFSTLRVRLLLLILLAILPAMGLTLYTGMERRRDAAADTQRGALQLARLASANQSRLIEEGHHLLAGLAQLPAVRHRNPDACRAFFADLLKQYRRYSNFGVIDADGNVFCSAVPMNRPVNVASQPGLRRTIQTGEFSVGTYRIGRITGNAMMPLNYPVLGVAGRVEVVVFAALDLGSFNQFAAQVELPTDSTLTVIDRNGTILVHHPSPERWVGKSVPEAPIIKAILDQQAEGAVEAVGEDGVARLYAFTPLRGEAKPPDAYLSIGIPGQVAYAETNRILKRNLAGLGFITVIALGVAWVGSNVVVLRRVRSLVRATSRLANGDLAARAGMPNGGGELGQLARSFDQMAEALEQRKAEADRGQETLREHTERLQILSRRLVEVQEVERRHIARELHDEIGQEVTAAKINLQAMQRLPGAAALSRRLEETLRIVERLLQRVRSLSLDLRPPILDDLGLVAALRWYIDQQARRAEYVSHFAADPSTIRLSADIETACFRVVQEALTNVAKHAQARRVEIALRGGDAGVGLVISDDGIGFDVRAARDRGSRGASLGLLGMEERVQIAGGEIEIESAPARGTRIQLRFPPSGQQRASG